MHPPAGYSTYSGGLFGGAPIVVNTNGTVSLGYAPSNFTGPFSLQSGATLNFIPAAGVSNTFTGSITNTNGSGSVSQGGPGRTILTGSNSYNGATTILDGALQASMGTGIPSGSLLALNGGVYQSNGSYTFNRGLGTSGGTFQWTAGGGGFSAGGGALTVNVFGDGRTLAWGSSVGTQIVGPLVFGSETAAYATTFINGINLGSAVRTIRVDDNPSTSSDYAQISGVITGTGGLAKTGPGILILSTTPTYSGNTVISEGALQTTLPSGFLSLDGGVFQCTAHNLHPQRGSSGSGNFQWTSNGGGFSAAGGQ